MLIGACLIWLLAAILFTINVVIYIVSGNIPGVMLFMIFAGYSYWTTYNAYKYYQRVKSEKRR